MNIPKKYYKGLSFSDRKKQKRNIKTSKKSYQKKKICGSSKAKIL